MTTKTPTIENKSIAPVEDKALKPDTVTASAAKEAQAETGVVPVEELQVTVALAHHWREHGPGETVRVHVDVADELQRGGYLAARVTP